IRDFHVTGVQTCALPISLDALPAGQAEPGAADPAAQCAGQRFTHDILRDLGYERLVIDASVGYRTGDGRLVIDVVNNVADMYDFALTLTFEDRKSTRLNSSHVKISYAVFCLKKKKITSH